MTDITDEALKLIDDSMEKIAAKRIWLELAKQKHKGYTGSNPAPGYKEAQHSLALARAKARGQAEVLALVVGVNADTIAREAAKRYKAKEA